MIIKWYKYAGAYLSSGVNNIANGVKTEISYWANTPTSQKASDLGAALTNPATSENVAAGATLMALPLKGTGSVMSESSNSLITNPVPSKVARVIPADIESATLGATGASDVFVTAAKDIK